ncbi:hypothetical protein RK21_04951 [Pseudomonas plecoglossicida]|nr:hypothetical protein RK21_04951 [Pseudomonas plecoglossicida]
MLLLMASSRVNPLLQRLRSLWERVYPRRSLRAIRGAL